MRPRPAFHLTLLVALVCAGVVAASAASYSAPTPVLTGLSHPGASAIGPDGSRYFTQHADANSAGLWVLPPGATSPTELYTVAGDPSCTNFGSSCSTPAIFSVDFDKHGNIYFGVQIYHSTSVDSSVVRIDRNGRQDTLWSGTAQSPDLGGTVTTGAALNSLTAVGSDVYLGTNAFDDSLGTQVARILVLHSKKPPQLLAQLNGAGSQDSISQLAVTPGGTVYTIDRDGGSNTLYEITGSSDRAVTSLPGTGNWLGVDGQGNVFVYQRLFNNRTSFSCADSTTIRIFRFAAGPTGISASPTVYSEATYPGAWFGWVPGSALFRVSSAGDVYFGLTELECPSSAAVQFDLIGINATRGQQEVLDSFNAGGTPFAEMEGGFSSAIEPTTGQLQVTNEGTGTLETIGIG